MRRAWPLESARTATDRVTVPAIAVSYETQDSTISAGRGPLALLERIALAAASILVSINVVTGLPLLALWIGSRAANGNVLSWIGIITAIVSLGVLVSMAGIALSRLSTRYDKVIGRPPPPRQKRPWELSLSAERAATGRARRETNAVEVMVVLTVVGAVIALEVWFFFFATNPLATG